MKTEEFRKLAIALEQLPSARQETQLAGIVEADETFFLASAKG
jgi:hypothetical protein